MDHVIAGLKNALPEDYKLHTGTEVAQVLKSVYCLFLDNELDQARSQIFELVTDIASTTQRRLLYEDQTAEVHRISAGLTIVKFIEDQTKTIFAFLRASTKQETGFHDDTFFMLSAYGVLWDLEDRLDDHIDFETKRYGE